MFRMFEIQYFSQSEDWYSMNRRGLQESLGATALETRETDEPPPHPFNAWSRKTDDPSTRNTDLVPREGVGPDFGRDGELGLLSQSEGILGGKCRACWVLRRAVCGPVGAAGSNWLKHKHSPTRSHTQPHTHTRVNVSTPCSRREYRCDPGSASVV